MDKAIDLALHKLEIKSCPSESREFVCTLDEKAVADILQQCGLTEGTVVVWQVNRIRWGRWQQRVFTFADGEKNRVPLWLEVRIFNQTGELHLVREKGAFQGRFRGDGQGETAEYVDSLSRFWGEKTEVQNGWLTLEDKDRKLKLVVPQAAEAAQYYGLVTRNYVGVDVQTAQAGYVDYRYVAIVSADVKERKKDAE